MLKLSEDLVITIAVAVGLAVALCLTIVAGVWYVHFPPTIIATFLAVALAALTYRFLGGVTGTEFSVGLLKLGGSAAFIVGLIYFVGDRLREEQRTYESSEAYRLQIASLQKQLGAQAALAAQKDGQVRELTRKLAGGPEARRAYTLEEIRKLAPNDPLVRDIKQLVKGQEYPFQATVRDIPVKIAVIRTPSDAPLYNICEDTLAKLNEGIEVPQSKVLLSRSAGDAGPQSIEAERNGRIGADICEAPDRAFDVQINCPVALKLFPDVLATCSEGVKAKGMRVSLGALTE